MDWVCGFGAVRRRFWEKGDEFDGLGFWASAWISGGGFGVSRARACCGVIEEKSRAAAKVACDGRLVLGFFVRSDFGMRNFLLEREGRLVVLGVGGERRIWLPRKAEENRGFVVEAMDGFFSVFLSLFVSGFLSLY